MPSVNKGESQKDYVSRCMGDSGMLKEAPDQKQRAAICYSLYKQHKKKKESKGDISEPIWEDTLKEPIWIIEK